MDYNVVRFMTKFEDKKSDEGDAHDDNYDIISRAIRKKAPLKIVYLKPDDEKTKRVVIPKAIGEMSHEGNTFIGMRAFCLLRHADRTFRLDRILELKEIDVDIPDSDFTEVE